MTVTLQSSSGETQSRRYRVTADDGRCVYFDVPWERNVTPQQFDERYVRPAVAWLDAEARA